MIKWLGTLNGLSTISLSNITGWWESFFGKESGALDK